MITNTFNNNIMPGSSLELGPLNAEQNILTVSSITHHGRIESLNPYCDPMNVPNIFLPKQLQYQAMVKI